MPAEAPTPAAPVVGAPLLAAPTQDTAEFTTFNKTVEDIDATIPIRAAYLTCIGCRLANAALSFHHSAASNAPTGTFRHDVPPGLKSAEATKAWLDTHMADMMKIATSGEVPDEYTRAKDLKQAALLASSELGRGLQSAATAGLKFDERYAELLKTAARDLDAAHVLKPQAAVADDERESLYALGADVLGGCYV